MKEKVKLPIENLIIKKKNIMDLAEYLFFQENKKEVSYRIKFKNEQEIEGDDISIFKNRKFEEYEINFIHMNYYSKEFRDRIEIHIYNNDTSGISDIEITSSNGEWFAVTEKKIKEILSFCDKQIKLSRVFENISALIFLLIVMSTISSIFFGIVINKIINVEEDLSIAVLLMCFSICLIINKYLFENLNEAFPKVEISIAEKNNIARKKRKSIVGIVTLVVLPIVLNIIYDLLKFIMF